MKIDEIRRMTDDELKSEVLLLQDSLFRLRFRRVTEQMEDSSEMKRVKKDVARIKTVIKERELGLNRG